MRAGVVGLSTVLLTLGDGELFLKTGLRTVLPLLEGCGCGDTSSLVRGGFARSLLLNAPAAPRLNSRPAGIVRAYRLKHQKRENFLNI